MYNNGRIPEGTVLLGAFAGNEVRGTATPLSFGGEKYFFLTVYTNNSSENITFKVYFGSVDSVLDATEQLTILANGVYGSLSDPYLINTFFQFNHAPLVSGIPNQTVESGNSFTVINLNNYLIEQENDPVIWSYRKNAHVLLNIADSTVTVTYPALWTGTDTVIFRATENNDSGLYGEDTAVFSVVRVDHAPFFNSIPGQTIGKNTLFAPANLRSYVTETDGDSLGWSYTYITAGGNDAVPTWTVNPALFNASMTVTAEVNFPGGTVNGNNNFLAAFVGGQVRGVASGINFAGKQLFFLTIYSNTVGDSITFRYYDATVMKNVAVKQKTTFVTNASLGTPSVPYTIDAGDVYVSINQNGLASFARNAVTWFGSNRIRFTVCDTGTLNGYQDTTSAVYTVLNDNTPLISAIPDQSVVAPQSFSSISLNTYITELDGDGITISVLNNTHVQVSIGSGNVANISVTPPDWSGTEYVIFRVTDNTANALYTQDTVTLNLRSTDNSPVFRTIPTQFAARGGSFQTLNILSYITETDGDSLAISYSIKQAPPNASSPSWVINPSLFQQNMTVTAELTSAGIKTTGTLHKLAAYAPNGELRGVATPLQFGNKWLYFLTVYANSAGENITFKFFDAVMQKIYPVQGSVVFASNAVLGSPSSPLQMNAGYILFTAAPNRGISATTVDSTWTGTETLTVIVTDAVTPNHYGDTTDVLYQVGGTAELQLTVLVEGLYNAATDMMIADSVSVVLKRTSGLYERVDSVLTKLNNRGSSNIAFAAANQTDSYYLVIKHRNSIETWSRLPMQFINNLAVYNFSSDSAKAYGNNMRKKGVKWCLMSGDVNQDGFVDFSDLTLVDNASYNYLSGYLPEDLNGDNFVDFSDLTIADNGAYNYSILISPQYPVKRPVPNPVRGNRNR